MSGVECRGLDRDLVCVLFPGIVKNDDKAIQCLGGIKGISLVHSQPLKKRLGLSFQPDNPFVKRVFANAKKTAGVLIKVKVKKVKVNNEVKREVLSTDVVGRVSNIYRFESMCDFQYLPLYKEVSGAPLQCLLDITIPKGDDDLSFLTGPAPLFIVPSNFTRSDRPINYTYTDKRYPNRSGSPEEELHNKSRSDRGMPLGHWWHFNLTDDFPSEPPSFYINNRNMKYEFDSMLKEQFEQVEKLFAERPIWSLNLLRYQTKQRLGALKVIVPCLSVFMKDGPWKSLWVRFGYDPRAQPEARKYQTLDFRLRHQAGIHSMVMTRDQVVHYKKADRVRRVPKRRAAPDPSEVVPEGAVFFRPGMVPAQRQIFYQLCDVKLPEVEEILAAEVAPFQKCHERLGWLPPNAIETCRDLIFRYVKQTLLATHSADMKLEQGVSSDDDDNDDNVADGDSTENENDDTLQ